MKMKICLIIAAVGLFAPGQLRAVDIDFYSDDTIENGDVYDIVRVYDTPPDYTTLDMLGGSVGSFRTYDSSTANIYSGELLIDPQSYNSSTINIYGGTIVCESIVAWDSSTLNIYAGTLYVDNSPYFSQSSTVNIYGYSFNYDGFQLTGFLSDDSSFTIRELSQAEYEHITLIPEPSSLLLLVFGSLVMRLRKNN